MTCNVITRPKMTGLFMGWRVFYNRRGAGESVNCKFVHTVPELEDLEDSISNSRSQLLLQIRKELTIMLRKTLTLGIGFILAVTLLSVSMVLCFTYDAEADEEWHCSLDEDPNYTCIFSATSQIQMSGLRIR